MSQTIASVGISSVPSTKVRPGSGNRSMSLSKIFWKPRMLDPSKPMPSLNRTSVNLADRDAEVLPAAEEVREPEIHHLDAALPRVADDVGRLGLWLSRSQTSLAHLVCNSHG